MTPEIYISYAWRDREKTPQAADRLRDLELEAAAEEPIAANVYRGGANSDPTTGRSSSVAATCVMLSKNGW